MTSQIENLLVNQNRHLTTIIGILVKIENKLGDIESGILLLER